MKLLLLSLLLISTSSCELENFVLPNYSTALSQAVVDYILNFFDEISTTVNLYYVSKPENLNVNLDIINDILDDVKTNLVVQVDGNDDYRRSQRKRENNILFVDSLESFMAVYKKIEFVHFEYQGFYLIAITTYSDDMPIYELMNKIFDAMWRKHIINTNIIFMPPENTNEAILFTFYPYSFDYCEEIIPVELNHFMQDKWQKEIIYFPRKLQNFQGCPLRVATFSNSPFMLINTNKNGSITVDGIEGILLRVLAQRLNFKLDFTISKDQWGTIYRNKTYTGAIQMIVNSTVNMTIGFFASLPERNQIMEASYAYYTTNLVWIVPPGKRQTALEKLANPLKKNVWIMSTVAIVIGFIAIAVIKQTRKVVQNFVFGSKIQSPAMSLINIILGNSLHQVPMRNFSRFLLILAIIFFFIIRVSYESGLVRFMQMDTRKPHMMRTKQLIASNFSFYMTETSKVYVLEMPEVLERTKIIPSGSYAHMLQELVKDPYYDGAFLTTISHLAYRNYKVFPSSFHEYAPKPIYTINIVIYMTPGSCLTIPFNELIIEFLSSGLMNKWASDFINLQYLKKPRDDSLKILNLEQLEGAFEMLATGLLVSFVVFCGELLVTAKTIENIKRSCGVERRKAVKISKRKPRKARPKYDRIFKTQKISTHFYY